MDAALGSWKTKRGLMNPLAVDNSKISPTATESRLQVRLSIGRRIEFWPFSAR